MSIGFRPNGQAQQRPRCETENSGGENGVTRFPVSKSRNPDGALVALSGGSVFKLTGSFGSFSGAGTNTVNLPTSLAGFTVNTTLVPGFGVALGAGVCACQITVSTSFTPFSGTGAVTSGGVAMKIADSASKVKLGP